MEFVSLASFNILSHKVVDLNRLFFHRTTLIEVVNKVVYGVVVIFPILTSAEIVGTNLKFSRSVVGAVVKEFVIHLCGEQVGNRAERVTHLFKLTPSFKLIKVEPLVRVSITPSHEHFCILGEVNILLIIEREVAYAESVNFICPHHSPHRLWIGGSRVGAGYKSADNIGEVGCVSIPTRKEVYHLSLARTGLDGCTLNSIEDTCVDVKTVIT
jgi:hypothetical protein